MEESPNRSGQFLPSERKPSREETARRAAFWDSSGVLSKSSHRASMPDAVMGSGRFTGVHSRLKIHKMIFSLADMPTEVYSGARETAERLQMPLR